MEKEKPIYISLQEATQYCSYSRDYLKLRARQGKLKSVKLGKKWMTTLVWIDEYTLRMQEWSDKMELSRKNIIAPNNPYSHNIVKGAQ